LLFLQFNCGFGIPGDPAAGIVVTYGGCMVGSFVACTCRSPGPRPLARPFGSYPVRLRHRHTLATRVSTRPSPVNPDFPATPSRRSTPGELPASDLAIPRLP
jgi:hypothetical protein